MRALTDASLTVRRGEVVALMGANGAGKSTFVKILTGAIRPDKGRVTIRGAEARRGLARRGAALGPRAGLPGTLADPGSGHLGQPAPRRHECRHVPPLGRRARPSRAQARRDDPRPAAGHTAHHRPRPRARQHARRAASGRTDRSAADRPRGAGAAGRATAGRGRARRHLHLPPLRRDRRALRPCDRPARRTQRRRRGHCPRHRGPAWSR